MNDIAPKHRELILLQCVYNKNTLLEFKQKETRQMQHSLPDHSKEFIMYTTSLNRLSIKRRYDTQQKL